MDDAQIKSAIEKQLRRSAMFVPWTIKAQLRLVDALLARGVRTRASLAQQNLSMLVVKHPIAWRDAAGREHRGTIFSRERPKVIDVIADATSRKFIAIVDGAVQLAERDRNGVLATPISAA